MHVTGRGHRRASAHRFASWCDFGYKSVLPLYTARHVHLQCGPFSVYVPLQYDLFLVRVGVGPSPRPEGEGK